MSEDTIEKIKDKACGYILLCAQRISLIEESIDLYGAPTEVIEMVRKWKKENQELFIEIRQIQ